MRKDCLFGDIVWEFSNILETCRTDDHNFQIKVSNKEYKYKFSIKLFCPVGINKD